MTKLNNNEKQPSFELRGILGPLKKMVLVCILATKLPLNFIRNTDDGSH